MQISFSWDRDTVVLCYICNFLKNLESEGLWCATGSKKFQRVATEIAVGLSQEDRVQSHEWVGGTKQKQFLIYVTVIQQL